MATMRLSLGLAAGVAIAAMLAPGAARADQIDDQAKVCADITADPDMTIGACTAVMQSGRWSGANLSWAYANRCGAYVDKGDYPAGIKDCDQALRLNPNNAEAYNNRGIAYKGTGQYQRAIDDYNQTLRLNPNHPDAYNNRGVAYAALGQCSRAIPDYDRAIQLNPRVRNSHRNRGRCYQTLGQYARAVQDFDEAIRLKPDDADAYYFRYDANIELGRYDQAIADADTAARLVPNWQGGNNARCWARAVANRDLGTALEACNRGLQLKPNDANTLDSRGFVYFRMGQLAAARADYDAALGFDPKLDSALYIRGIIKRRMGDGAGADADIAAAKAINPKVAARYATFGVTDSGPAAGASPAPAPVATPPVQAAPPVQTPPPPPSPPAPIQTPPTPATLSGFTPAPVPEVQPGRMMLSSKTCRQSDDLEKALRECRMIVQNGGLSGQKLGAYYNRCAEIELLLGKFDDAVKDMEKALREDPGNRSYEANLAYAKQRAGR